MKTGNMSVTDYTNALSSKAPVPGGGGASALSGALSASLAQMVCNLTIGKKKYADAEEEITRIGQEMKEKQDKFLFLADQDAEVFEPLSRAYSLPALTEEEKKKKEQIMEDLLAAAANVPLRIMEEAAAVSDGLAVLLEKGSTLAVSDVGCAAGFVRAAISGGMLNVKINTKLMKDREKAAGLDRRAGELFETGIRKADDICKRVLEKMGS